MKRISLILLCTLCLTSLFSQESANYAYELIDDTEIKSRLSTIHNDIVKPRFDPAVRSYINTYTVKKRDKTEAMLGRRSIYFPLFERLLAESGLPTDLKYLSIVESALNAEAVSRSGAVGLWQFMKPTGKECGLQINRTVDERKDPEKATRAAIKYLSKQYKRYGNWELALAAYNGGPGRVNRAIKRGRSKNFWRIRRHLPRETRNYVPAFIAATYVNHFYEHHGLQPIYPDADFQLTALTRVYDDLTFDAIAEMTGTPQYIIEFLNPSYQQGFIPASVSGRNLVLPEDKMAIFRNQYRSPDSGNREYYVGERILVLKDKPSEPSNSFSFYYRTQVGETMDDLSKAFQCDPTEIMKWNRLTTRKLRTGQNILVYIPKNIWQNNSVIEPIPVLETTVKPKVSEINSAQWKPIPLPKVESKSKKRKKKKKAKKKRYSYHKIARGESLFTIAAQYEGVSVKDLIELNNIQPNEPLEKGKKLKVKEKG